MPESLLLATFMGLDALFCNVLGIKYLINEKLLYFNVFFSSIKHVLLNCQAITKAGSASGMFSYCRYCIHMMNPANNIYI